MRIAGALVVPAVLAVGCMAWVGMILAGDTLPAGRRRGTVGTAGLTPGTQPAPQEAPTTALVEYGEHDEDA